MLFTTYVVHIWRLIDSYSISYHKYADDMQLYTTLTIDRPALDRLADSSNGLQLWFKPTIYFWTQASQK